jgi:hypothetical protein
MDPVQTLIEREALRDLKARYFRFLDTKDWESWTTVWAPEIDHEMPTEGQMFHGPREAFVRSVATALEGVVTVHHGHTSEIEVTSPTTAKAIWAFEDQLKPGPDAPPGAPDITGYGHYHETYEKSDAGWRIKTQRITRLRLDFHGEPPANLEFDG